MLHPLLIIFIFPFLNNFERSDQITSYQKEQKHNTNVLNITDLLCQCKKRPKIRSTSAKIWPKICIGSENCITLPQKY